MTFTRTRGARGKLRRATEIFCGDNCSPFLSMRGRHMFKINSVRISLAALLFALCFIFGADRAMAQSQASTGQIIGTVKDPQGAPVSGATVKVSNVATGLT